MKKRGTLLIVNALIWGALMVAAAFVFRGTDAKERVLALVGGGLAVTSGLIGLVGKKSDAADRE